MELYTKIIIIALLVGALTVTPVLSTLTDSTVIESKGTISNVFAVTAESGYWQDVQNAVDQVATAGGGNVYIPAGTFNFVRVGESWTGARVTIPAGVNVIGSYSVSGNTVTWNTVLKVPWDVPGGWLSGVPVMFSVSGSGSGLSQQTSFVGLKLVGYRSIDSSSTQLTLGLTIKDTVDFRVGYCYFEHMTGGGVSVSGVDCCGVIDHSHFVNLHAYVASIWTDCTVGYGVQVHRTYTQDLWDPIENVLGKYTSYTVFIEDCHFERWRHEISANDGAHYVARHNVFGPSFGFQTIDAHPTYGIVSTRAIEVYDNSFVQEIGTGMPKSVCAWTGGGGVWFDNTQDGSFEYSYIMVSAGGDVKKCWAHDVYIWNSDQFSVTNPITKVGSDGLVHPALNVDYFLYEPSWYTPYPYPHPLTLMHIPP